MHRYILDLIVNVVRSAFFSKTSNTFASWRLFAKLMQVTHQQVEFFSYAEVYKYQRNFFYKLKIVLAGNNKLKTLEPIVPDWFPCDKTRAIIGLSKMTLHLVLCSQQDKKVTSQKLL